MNSLLEKIRELYSGGLTKKQGIIFIVVIVMITIIVFLWIFYFRSGSANKDHSIPNQYSGTIGSEIEKTSIASENITENQEGVNPGQQYPKAPNVNTGSPVKQIDLPEIPKNIPKEASDNPGPMDGTIAKIKEEYKNAPNYNVIVGFLEPIKEIADGKRAWNSLFRMEAEEFLGKRKAREIEAEIKRINGNKEEKIRRMTFANLDEVINAINKDTEKYVQKGAINGFLDHSKQVVDDRYPWTDSVKEIGEIELEKAWVDQVDNKVKLIKEQKARNFRSVHYKSLDQLILAIKEDTKNFEQTFAVGMFLDYLKEQYNSRALTEASVTSGSDLMDDYHLNELKKFVNKK